VPRDAGALQYNAAIMEPSIQYCRTSDDVNIAYAVIGDGSPVVFSSTIEVRRKDEA
jgi:hypothetical protein